MPAYFDTSALVPLLIAEPSTVRCTQVWNTTDLVVSSALAYVEVHAALAQAQRQRRLDADSHRRAILAFDEVWKGVASIPVDDAVIHHAAEVAGPHALRGYDAVHCAAAQTAASADLIAVSGDRELLRAWGELGIATVDTLQT